MGNSVGKLARTKLSTILECWMDFGGTASLPLVPHLFSTEPPVALVPTIPFKVQGSAIASGKHYQALKAM